MPWKVTNVSELRLVLVHHVRTLGRPVAAAAREFGVSRKTAHKWLKVHDADPAAPLGDRSRRPKRSPGRTPPGVEAAVLAVRDQRNWGPRKIRAHLLRTGAVPAGGAPSARTLANVLRRNGRVGDPPGGPADPPVHRFERGGPNDLWQVDHQGRVEVDRRRLYPLTVLDDHTRYLLAYEPVGDKTMAVAWDVLWGAFDAAGLPREVLDDNAFNTLGVARPVGLSWFDGRPVRLGIRPLHGRPYHPQTQGKVERVHGSAARELLYFDARRGDEAAFRADCARWRRDYNTLRPHEALGDAVPADRWVPSPRRRPPALPDPESYYPAGSVLRKVCDEGLVRFAGCRILLGRGIAGQPVRVEARDGGAVAVFYCWKEVRCLSHDQLLKDRVL